MAGTQLDGAAPPVGGVAPSEKQGTDLAAFADVVLLPYHWGTDPCNCTECNRGYCLPGDPVPFLVYPPNCA